MDFEFRISDCGFATHPPDTRCWMLDAGSTRPPVGSPQITQKNTDGYPPAPVFNAKTRSRKGAKPAHPRFARSSPRSTQMATHPPESLPADHADRRRLSPGHQFSTQRRGGAETQRVCLAVLDSGEVLAVKDGQNPLGWNTTSKTSFRRCVPTQRPALEDRRPRLLPSSILKRGLILPHPKLERGRRDRHAGGVAAGGATGLDERSRSERPGAPPVAGDLRIAGAPAGQSRSNASSLTGGICVICVICGQTSGGRAALRLCASAPLRFLPSSGQIGSSVAAGPEGPVYIWIMGTEYWVGGSSIEHPASSIGRPGGRP